MTRDPYKFDATGIFNPRLQVEGWEECAAAETESRNDSMLGLTDEICGLSVKPLTWRHLLWLDIYNSPFLSGAAVETLLQIPDIHLHVARFMWVCSPKWNPFGKLARWLYFRRYRKTLYGKKNNTLEIVSAIHKFVDDSTWDLRADAGNSIRRGYYSPAAGIVEFLCGKFPALSPDPDSDKAAIDLPVKIIGQLLRAHIRGENPKALMSNRTDELERNWLAEVNRRNQSN